MFGKVLDFFGWWRVYDFAHGFFSGDELLSPSCFRVLTNTYMSLGAMRRA